MSVILLRFANRRRGFRYPLKQFTVKGSRAIIFLRMESASVTLSPIVLPPPIGSDTPSYRLSSHQPWHAPCRHSTHSQAKALFTFSSACIIVCHISTETSKFGGYAVLPAHEQGTIFGFHNLVFFKKPICWVRRWVSGNKGSLTALPLIRLPDCHCFSVKYTVNPPSNSKLLFPNLFSPCWSLWSLLSPLYCCANGLIL